MYSPKQYLAEGPGTQSVDQIPQSTSANHDAFDYDIDRENSKNIRIVQRNVIYVIGIPKHLMDEKILSSNAYFGQYGELFKVILNLVPHVTAAIMNQMTLSKKITSPYFCTFMTIFGSKTCYFILN